jgi:hypothetical protein
MKKGRQGAPLFHSHHLSAVGQLPKVCLTFVLQSASPTSSWRAPWPRSGEYAPHTKACRTDGQQNQSSGFGNGRGVGNAVGWRGRSSAQTVLQVVHFDRMFRVADENPGDAADAGDSEESVFSSSASVGAVGNGPRAIRSQEIVGGVKGLKERCPATVGPDNADAVGQRPTQRCRIENERNSSRSIPREVGVSGQPAAIDYTVIDVHRIMDAGAVNYACCTSRAGADPRSI